jgi:hypothetical protein
MICDSRYISPRTVSSWRRTETTRPVADEQPPVAVEDIPARPGHDDSPLALLAFGLVVLSRALQLSIAEAHREGDDQHRQHEVEEDDPRIVAAVRLEQLAGAVGEIDVVGGHGCRGARAVRRTQTAG